MPHTTIMSTAVLAEHLDDPAWVILDARFDLDDEAWAARAFTEAHIPGAQQADLARDMAGPIVPGVTGRRPFPDSADFAATLSSWGVVQGTQVVVYDGQSGIMAAARLWHMIRWMGHDAVAVLDGGLHAWSEEGRPLSDALPARQPTDFTPSVRDDLLASLDEVERIRSDPDFRLLDARSAEAFRGEGVYHDPKRGHIPGASLCDRGENVRPDGRFKSPHELRARFDEVIGDTPPESVVFYCGSGVVAAQNVLAMEIAGLSGSRLFVGSWSEWIVDDERGVEL